MHVLISGQMPLVDGTLSTRMIRFSEKESRHRGHSTRDVQSPLNRVAIIAVASSLQEENRFDYMQSGYVIIFQKKLKTCCLGNKC